MMGIGYCAFPLNLSLYVTGKGLGGAASVSMGMTMITVVGALVGLAFSPLVRASKFFVSPVAAVFGLIATLVTIFSQSLAMIFVGAALAGIYYGINTASPGYYIGRICTKEQYGPTYSMAMTCNFMGLILSPIILNLLIVCGAATPTRRSTPSSPRRVSSPSPWCSRSSGGSTSPADSPPVSRLPRSERRAHPRTRELLPRIRSRKVNAAYQHLHIRSHRIDASDSNGRLPQVGQASLSFLTAHPASAHTPPG